MRTWAGLLLFVSLLAGVAPAQDVSGVIYLRKRAFPVPFNVGSGGQNLESLQLYVSRDSGRTWQSAATAPPEQGRFQFAAERDGSYWFAVQTTDKAGRVFPLGMDGATPNLKVVVDTTPPVVELRPLASRGNEVGVSWIVRDETFAANIPNSMVLEFRSAATPGNWTKVDVPLGASQVYWNPGMQGPIEVRFMARDQAGNTGDSATRVGPGVAGADPSTVPTVPVNPNNRFAIDPAVGTERFPGIANPPTPNELKLVNSKRIGLDFDLKDKGPSGVAGIELWLSTDGKNWSRYNQPFQDDGTNRLVFDVDREGLYGITLVAKSGVGIGDPPPQSADRPQLWVEVDLTKPQVAIKNVQVGKGIDKGKLRVTWNATDRNLAPNGVSLKYTDQPSNPWKLVAEKVANTGEYTWTMPADVPYQFYLKVEAADRAGNVGEDATPQPIRVDLSHPRAVPREIGPAAN